MNIFNPDDLKKMYISSPDSHKGQNGKLLVIGGSHLFHAASLWSLQIASKIVDMVFYSSVPENNKIVLEAKKEFRNGIVVERKDIEHYAKEADAILIGPGLVRAARERLKIKDQRLRLEEINQIEDEGEQTYWLTKLLLKKFPEKKFILDAGSLQMMDPEWLLGLKEMPILTPHQGEFEMLFGNNNAKEMAKKYNCVILLKGEEDLVCSLSDCVKIIGGNAGMTKGGTGDVLAGFAAALYTKNNAFLAACAASFLNKKAGENLFKKVGLYFNSSDLVEEIPLVMKKFIAPVSL